MNIINVDERIKTIRHIAKTMQTTITDTHTPSVIPDKQIYISAAGVPLIDRAQEGIPIKIDRFFTCTKVVLPEPAIPSTITQIGLPSDVLLLAVASAVGSPISNALFNCRQLHIQPSIIPLVITAKLLPAMGALYPYLFNETHAIASFINRRTTLLPTGSIINLFQWQQNRQYSNDTAKLS